MATAKRPRLTPPQLALLILICFFLSGFTGLIYEVLWTRMIVKIIGGAPFAISIILTIFMGGLGLGSYLAGRVVDRVTQPEKLVAIYGILELIIGAYGLILPLLITLFRPLFALVYNGVFEYSMLYSLLTFAGCAVVLIIPVTCMGATLPVLSRFYVSNLGHLGTHTGRLYGLNTIGAGFGALATGFWLLAAFGVWGSLAVAVALNAAIGLLCLFIGSRSRVAKPRPAIGKDSSTSAGNSGATLPPAVINGALIVFAVSGFCSMSYEVIWTKLLGLMVGPTTYSFTVVLVTFIIGLALGAMFFGWLADRLGKPAQLLLITQIIAAAAALAVSQILGNSQFFWAKLIASYQDSFSALSVMKALLLFLFMLPPTLCLGATFPLVSKIFTPSTARIGRSIGLAYAVNTIGAVLGSFMAGFVIIPALGKAHGLSFVIILHVLGALAFGALLIIKRAQRIRSAAPAMAAAVAVLIFGFIYPAWDHNLLALGKYHRIRDQGVDPDAAGWVKALLNGPEILKPLQVAEVVYYGDGVAGATSVLKDTDAMGNVSYSMTNAGKPDASSRADMPTQTILAHFPLLFTDNAKSVMVIGLASGVTAGEVLHYPVDRLDVVEISNEVVMASDFFKPWNGNVLADPRTHLIVQDGRAHLTMTNTKYDVVISEPSNPWMAGLATLFTRDFFEHVHHALNEDGMFVQFIHAYQMDWGTFALVGRTFADVFPNSMLVSVSPAPASNDYLLIGIKGDQPIDIAGARDRVRYLQRSQNIRLSDAALLLRLVRADNLRSLFGIGPLNTDSRPFLEYAAPKLLFQSDEQIALHIATQGAISTAITKVTAPLTQQVESQIAFTEYLMSVKSPFAGPIPAAFSYGQATPEQIQRYHKLIGDLCGSELPVLTTFEDERTREFCAECEMQKLRELIDRRRGNEKSYHYLSHLLKARDQWDDMFWLYTRWVEAEPDEPVARRGLADLSSRRGELDDALMHLLVADREDRDNPAILADIGYVYGSMKKYSLAKDYFRRSLAINRDYAPAYAGLGAVQASTGDTQGAIEQFRTALRLDPTLEQARIALARLQAAQ